MTHGDLRIPVGGERPYDVLVGRDCSASCPRCSAGRARVAVRAPADRCRGRADAVADDADRRGAARRCRSRCPTPRRARPSRWPRGCWDPLGRSRLHPYRRRGRGGRRRRHRPGRLRRRVLAARRARGAGPDQSARHGRRGGRRQDRRSTPRPARTWSARSTRRPACCATCPRWTPCRRPTCVAGLAEVVKCGLHRRPGDPRPDRGRPGGRRRPDRRRSLRELIERSMRVKARGRRRGPARVRACGRS